jgi:hypothetical protein
MQQNLTSIGCLCPPSIMYVRTKTYSHDGQDTNNNYDNGDDRKLVGCVIVGQTGPELHYYHTQYLAIHRTYTGSPDQCGDTVGDSAQSGRSVTDTVHARLPGPAQMGLVHWPLSGGLDPPFGEAIISRSHQCLILHKFLSALPPCVSNPPRLTGFCRRGATLDHPNNQ